MIGALKQRKIKLNHSSTGSTTTRTRRSVSLTSETPSALKSYPRKPSSSGRMSRTPPRSLVDTKTAGRTILTIKPVFIVYFIRESLKIMWMTYLIALPKSLAMRDGRNIQKSWPKLNKSYHYSTWPSSSSCTQATCSTLRTKNS